jgi:hypothetical protein
MTFENPFQDQFLNYDFCFPQIVFNEFLIHSNSYFLIEYEASPDFLCLFLTYIFIYIREAIWSD